MALARAARGPVLAALAPVGRGWLSHCGLGGGGTFPRWPHSAGSVADTGAVLLTERGRGRQGKKKEQR